VSTASNGIVLFPLLATTDAAGDYVLLDEALERKLFAKARASKMSQVSSSLSERGAVVAGGRVVHLAGYAV